MDRPRSEITAVALADISRKEKPSELAALKEFIPREELGAAAEQSARSRLHNEIEALKADRPGILKILDFNENERWIVTEYCEQGNLEDNLSKFKGNARLSISALVPVIKAVSTLHQEGIVHRDIKPQNIFLDEDGRLLLGDFGLVFLPHQAPRPTKQGESVGPWDFMPPWIDLDDQPVTARMNFDVYMLGKVLWCMVSGQVKLPRENFHHPRFNVVNLFPNDPHMYAINQILEKTVVSEEKDCYGSAIDLWLMTGKISEIMERGGQLLNDGIPRPCRVCGLGEYKAEQEIPGTAHPTTIFPLNRIVTINSTGQQIAQSASGIKANAFCCDRCGHVQFFKVGQI